VTPDLMDAGAKVRAEWQLRQASGGRQPSFGRLLGAAPDFAHGVALYLEDITVKTAYRRQGIGRALVNRAIDWTRSRQLPGIMLETQNNNVAACRFYERCGFELGGFDRHLYGALHPDTREIALYWYLVFPQEIP